MALAAQFPVRHREPGAQGGGHTRAQVADRSALYDDDPGDNPIGQIDDPAPIGEPLILLLLAALYGGYRLIKRKKVIS